MPPNPKVPLSDIGLALLHLWDMFSEDDTPEAWIEELRAANYGVIAQALEAEVKAAWHNEGELDHEDLGQDERVC